MSGLIVPPFPIPDPPTSLSIHHQPQPPPSTIIIPQPQSPPPPYGLGGDYLHLSNIPLDSPQQPPVPIIIPRRRRFRPTREQVTACTIRWSIRVCQWCCKKCKKDAEEARGGGEEEEGPYCLKQAMEARLADNLRPPDAESNELFLKFLELIKSKISDQKASPAGDLVLIGYKTQAVAGMDYFLKVKEIISGNIFHVRIYKSLQGEYQLQDISGPKTPLDKIEFY